MSSYRVQVWNPDATDYSPSTLAVEFENPKNLGFASYLNDVGEAFFTINQYDAKVNLRSIEPKAHVVIIRQDRGNEDVVWRGILAEHDATGQDVVFYAYGYEGLLHSLYSTYNQKWRSVKIAGASGRPIDDLWSRAKTIPKSPVQWISDGTTQAPLVNSNGSTTLTLNRYEARWKRILTAMKELTAVATSDTTNIVYMQIDYPSDPTDLSATFNYWKNRTADATDVRLEYPGNIIDFNDRYTPILSRNQTLAVGSGPRGQLYYYTFGQFGGTLGRTSSGTRQQNMYLSWVRDRNELVRVTKRRLTIGLREDTDVWVRCYPGKITPWRATASSHKLGDYLYTDIDRGITQINKNLLFIGEQVVFANGREYVQPMLEDRATAAVAQHNGWTWLTGASGAWGKLSPPIGTQTQTVSISIPANHRLAAVCTAIDVKPSSGGATQATAVRINGVAGSKIVCQGGLLSNLGNRTMCMWSVNVESSAGQTVDLEVDWVVGDTGAYAATGAASCITGVSPPTLINTADVTDSGGAETLSIDAGSANAVSIGFALTANSTALTSETNHEAVSSEYDIFDGVNDKEGHAQGSTQTNTGVTSIITSAAAKTMVAAMWNNEA